MTGVLVMAPNAASKELFTWIGFNLLGIGYSSAISISYGSFGHYFSVTNAMTSFIFVNGVIGETIYTTVLSKFIETKSVTYLLSWSHLRIIYVILSVLLNLYNKKVFEDPEN